MAFLDNVLLLCEQKGEKLTPLMKRLNLSPGNVQRWRDGATVNSDILLKFSSHFGVSIDYLLTGHEFSDSNAPTVSYKETKMLEMFRCLPEQSRDFIYDSIQTAYEKEIQRKETASKSLA